jgi:hypothetical protein
MIDLLIAVVQIIGIGLFIAAILSFIITRKPPKY